jgi:hypothetical protein
MAAATQSFAAETDARDREEAIRMSYITEELRHAAELRGDTYSSMELWGLLGRAADEIERLQGEAEGYFEAVKAFGADNVRLRAAFKQIEYETGETMLAMNHGKRGNIANEIARRALNDSKDGH